jgi:hypothetical protein
MSNITYEDYVEAAKMQGFDIELSEEEFAELSEENLQELEVKTMKSAERKMKTSRERAERKASSEEDKAMSTDGEKYPEKQARHNAAAGKAVATMQKREVGLGLVKKRLAAKKVKSEEVELDETAALDSLKGGSKPDSNPKSRVEMMAAVLKGIDSMPKRDLVKWFDQTMAVFGPGKTYGVGDNSEKNKSTIKMKPSGASSVKEDVADMFVGEELSEEFKEKASTIFEAALNARIIAETAALEEAYGLALEEEIETVTVELTEKLDTYLDYVVEQWMQENEVAIETSLRNELMDDFVESLKGVFAEHYIDVPQDKLDILEALTDKVSELEEKLNDTISENVELRKISQSVDMDSVFDEVSEGLALTQVERFRALAEGIEFDGDLTAYERKLNIIKEAYFSDKSGSSSKSASVLSEDFLDEDGQIVEIATTPEMKRWAQAISRTVKK